MSSRKTVFTKEFTRQESIPEEGIQRAVELLRSGRLHRYNTAAGEISDVALLEKEFAAYIGTAYCAAFSSCGSAMYVALKCAGVKPGNNVISNAFTLAPVPSAIENAGAQPLFVETTSDYTIDLNDLERTAATAGAHHFLLSYMRGHIPDMAAVTAICAKHNLCLIEDCAHTMGGGWDSRLTGTFGKIGCFSTQTYKHMNSGEGGLLVTDDDDVIAKAILYSGAYMLYDNHLSRPPLELFEKYKKAIPNYSLRMTNLQAAVLRPQLKVLDLQVARWNTLYDALATELNRIASITVPPRSPEERFVGSSIQFTLQGLAVDRMASFVEHCAQRGVQLKWFGRPEPRDYTSCFESWHYLSPLPELPQTKNVLARMCDMRIPLTFSAADCRKIATIIEEVLDGMQAS